MDAVTMVAAVITLRRFGIRSPQSAIQSAIQEMPLTGCCASHGREYSNVARANPTTTSKTKPRRRMVRADAQRKILQAKMKRDKQITMAVLIRMWSCLCTCATSGCNRFCINAMTTAVTAHTKATQDNRVAACSSREVGMLLRLSLEIASPDISLPAGWLESTP